MNMCHFKRFIIFGAVAAAYVAAGSVLHAEETIISETATSTMSEDGNASSDEEILARDHLRQQIEDRAKDLEKINQELSTVQKSLNQTKTERSSLQRELNTLQYTTNQLKLNIKSDEISVQKLGLEIQSLTFDVQDISESIKSKRLAISEIFREIQRIDQTNLLVIFLKRRSLADGILETQTLNDLSHQLTTDVGDLQNLHDVLTKKVGELSEKKDGVNLHRKNLVNRNLIVQEQKSERQNLLEKTKNKESVYQKQLSELQKLQQEISEEIESLDAELRTKIDPSLLPSAGSGVLGSPVSGIPAITQKYGSTKFAQTAYPGKWHNGIDIRAVVGAPIFAAEAGVVAAVGDQDALRGCYRGAYGKYVAINHENNLTTLSAHLSRYIVKSGDRVKKGDLIGYAGRTGYATGPHLHFTVFAQPTFYMGPSRVCGQMPFGGDLNPERYL